MRLERHAEEPPENHGTRPRLFIGGSLGAHTQDDAFHEGTNPVARAKWPTHWPQRRHTTDDLKCVKSRIEFEEPLRVD